MWIGYALGAAVFAGLTAILAKAGVRNTPSTLATALRTVVVLVGACVMVLIVGSGSSVVDLSPRTWLFLVLSGAATGASWLCYFRALQLGEAARVAPVDKLSVVLVAIFGVLFLGEALSWKNWAGVGLILVGVLLVATRD